jgi:cytochrome o ubiquinol oxidase subunit 1
MFWGEVRFTPPMLFSIGFIVTFVLGGFTGIILAMPPLDYVVHNTVFLVAHFHNMLIPGLLYGMIAGYQYWFPKAFGCRLCPGWGRVSFVCWLVGFYLAFMPLYVLGLEGMARRTQEVFEPDFRPWLDVALVGAILLFAGLGTLFVQLWVSVRDREANRVAVGDPWGARSLEWSVGSPPPDYNFATIPHAARRDAFYWRKANQGAYTAADHYRDIEVPRNSSVGPVIGAAGAICAFGLVWHIWWMAILGFGVMWGAVIARSFLRDTHRTIPAAEVEAADRRWLAAAAAAAAVAPQFEETSANRGLAERAA